MDSDKKKYKTIGQVAKILGLINKKNGKLSTHPIRFWEKEFRQVQPLIFSGKRRYYNDKSIIILKRIKFLLKDKGMTIKGVKKHLKVGISDLDEINNKTINSKIIKTKVKNISNILRNIKNG